MRRQYRVHRLIARSFLWLPIAAVVPWVACESSDDPIGPGGGDGSVQGVVAQLKSGEGVPNLVVVALREGVGMRSSVTGADGTFALSDLADGSYTVRLTGFELSPLSLPHTIFDPIEQTVQVSGGATEDLVFVAVGVIPPRIQGTVTCGGTPVAGARVRLVGGASDVTVETDGNGEFGSADLTEGSYAVIPVESPCALSPDFHVIEARKSATATAGFAG